MIPACARAGVLGLGLGLELAALLFSLERGASGPVLAVAGFGLLALILGTPPATPNRRPSA